MEYPYASLSELQNLKSYKYHGVDRSIFAKLLQPFWSAAVMYLPETLAPNMVTLIGFMFMIFSFLLQVSFCTNGIETVAPRWVYLVHCFCLFAYQTLDALDGKQARRTGTSSPLGELFDHGCDAVTSSLLTITIASTLQIGNGWLVFFILMVSLSAFYLAQMEEYHTGTLDLWYFNVTEAQLFTMLLYLVTAAIGPEFWNEFFVINGNTTLFQYKHFPALIVFLGVFFTVISNFVRLIGGSKDGSIKLSKVIGHLVPVGSSCLFFSLWAYYSKIHILYNGKTVLPFLLSLGFLFAFMVGRIVLARMCKQDFSSIQLLSLPAAIGAFIAIFPTSFISEETFVIGYCILSIAAYLHLALNVIRILTSFLGIKCLSIPKKLDKSQ